jgi:hypothetical protein
MLGQKPPHLLPERLFFRTEIEVHLKLDSSIQEPGAGRARVRR